MKQKDLAILIVVVFVSGILSYVLSSLIFSKPTGQRQIEVVSQISSQFTTPSTKYFNQLSIDPTQLIEISNNSNQTPFGNSGQ